VDEAAELAELRRRAYGPGGGIDAAGIERLRELEGRAQAPAPARPVVDAGEHAELMSRAYGPKGDIDAAGLERLRELESRAPASTGGTAAEGATPAVAASAEHEGPGEPPSVAPAPAPVANGRRWPWIAGALLAGLLLGGGLSTAVAQTGPQPDAVLRIVDEDRPTRPDVPADAVMYQRYHDLDIRSWTDPHTQGLRCLAVLPPEAAEYTWSMCAPQSLSVLLDGQVLDEIQDDSYPFLSERVGDAPDGTVFRLELVGDVVKVWRVEPPAPTPAQAG
jgi:hypothetical protein